MSSGVTSYPRTGGGGGSFTQLIARLIDRLSVVGNQQVSQEAGSLIAALEQYAQSQPAPQSLITLACRVRDALFAAALMHNLRLVEHLRAMEICAEAWRQLYPLVATALGPRANHALQLVIQAAASGDPVRMRAAKEEIGIISWLYEASALLGQDLADSHAVNAALLGNSGYRGAHDSSGGLTYLECAGAYNINVLVSIDVSGAPYPMVLVGEAKGGQSQYGKVVGKKSFLGRYGVSTISQTDVLYPLSRAEYMAATRSQAPEQQARKAAGKMIIDAFADGRMVYLTARGDSQAGGPLSSTKEHFKCR
jgi:hypothetical protein